MMTGKENVASPEKPQFGSKVLKEKPAQDEKKVSEVPKELEKKPAKTDTKESGKQEPPALKELSSEEEASSEGAVAEEIQPKDKPKEQEVPKDKPKAQEVPPKPKTVPAPKPKPEEEKDEVKVPIWFATNRKTTETGTFTSTRDPEHNTFGRMDVPLVVAQNHTPPKNKEVAQYVKKKEDVFFTEIEERLETFRKLGVKPQVLVALHNYKVGFYDSLLNASHWQEDLNVAGATISYSWPSIGKKGNYEPDTATLERSEPEILDFLIQVSSLCGGENVHLLADGKSCAALLRVLQRMDANQVDLKFGQMFLIVPDIDRELFLDLAWLFPKHTVRTTLYASDIDNDASKSVKRHAAPRAGIFKPYTIAPGIDLIAIPGLETDYFNNESKTRTYEVLTLFYDMYDLMKSNAPPSRRLHLTKQVDEGKTYWKLRKL